MKKLTSLLCATALLLTLATSVTRAAQPFYSCMTDGFGETWSIYNTPLGGGNWSFSGTVNVGLPSLWNISGTGNSITGAVTITANNPSPDGCTQYVDYFTFTLNTYPGYLSGTWASYCTSGVINSGTITAKVVKGTCGGQKLAPGGFDFPGMTSLHNTNSSVVAPEGSQTYFDLANEDFVMSFTPNPASTNATITYTLAAKDNVQVSVYNFLGQQVKVLVNDVEEAGTYSLNWDVTDSKGASVPKGIYFLNAQTSAGLQSHAITIEK